jgi:hypothetical protein
MRRRLPVAASLTLVLVVGCGAIAERPEDGARATSSEIIHGHASTSAEDAVVALGVRQGGTFTSLCSGTLVAPNLVLTARHCVADADAEATCTADGAALAGGVVRADHAPADLFVYRGADAIGQLRADMSHTSPELAAARGRALVVEGSTLCNADLAFLVLDADVPGPYAALRTRPSSAGEALTAIGYGLDETGALPELRQERTGVTTLAIGPLGLPGAAGLGDAELLVGESACSGDSGGPLASPADGAVVGVVSRGGGGSGPAGNKAAGCTGAGAFIIYTHLATKHPLIQRAYAAAGRPAPPMSDAGVPAEDAGADASAARDAGPAPQRDAAPDPAGERDGAAPPQAPSPAHVDPRAAAREAPAAGGCSSAGAAPGPATPSLALAALAACAALARRSLSRRRVARG